jgi:putative endonuclease
MTSERFVAIRRAAERRGRRGEFVATLLLIAKGYRILGRRVRTRAGEIDLVARSPRGILCFVEVKTRNSMREAQEALLRRQETRIARAAELYLAQWRGLRPTRWPKHLRDSWRPGAR